MQGARTSALSAMSVPPPKWDVFDYKMKHFVDVCREGRKNEAPGEHGLMVQKMLDGIYESAEKGREVTIS